MTRPVLPFPAPKEAPAVRVYRDLSPNSVEQLFCQRCYPERVPATRQKVMSNGGRLSFCNPCFEANKREVATVLREASKVRPASGPVIENERISDDLHSGLDSRDRRIDGRDRVGRRRDSDLSPVAPEPPRSKRVSADIASAPVSRMRSNSAESGTALRPSAKPSVNVSKLQPLPECNLGSFPNVSWEKNSAGGLEAWHVPDGARTRSEKTYLGYAGKRQLEDWRRIDHPSAAIELWLFRRRTEKGIAVPPPPCSSAYDTM